MSQNMIKKGSLRFDLNLKVGLLKYECKFNRKKEDAHHGIESLVFLFYPDNLVINIRIIDDQQLYDTLLNNAFNLSNNEDLNGLSLSPGSKFLRVEYNLNDPELSKQLRALINFLNSIGPFGKESKKEMLQELSYRVAGIKVEDDNDVYESLFISAIQEPKECFERAQTLYDQGYKLVFWVLAQALEATNQKLALTALEKIQKNDAQDCTESGMTIFESSRLMMANIILSTLPEITQANFDKLSYQEQEELELKRKSIVDSAYHSLDEAGNSDIAVTLRTQILSRLISDRGLETTLPDIRLGSEASQTILELASENVRLEEEIAFLRRQNAELSSSLKLRSELRFTPVPASNSEPQVTTEHPAHAAMEIDSAFGLNL